MVFRRGPPLSNARGEYSKQNRTVSKLNFARSRIEVIPTRARFKFDNIHRVSRRISNYLEIYAFDTRPFNFTRE